MSNPWEYRQIMKAAMQYGEKRSVEEVLAEQERLRDERSKEVDRKAKSRKGTNDLTKPPPGMAPLPADAVDNLRKLLANTPLKTLPVMEAPAEVASPPNGNPR